LKQRIHGNRSAHKSRATRAVSASTKVVTNNQDKNSSEKQKKKGGGFFASLFRIFKKKTPIDTPTNENTAVTEITEELKKETTIKIMINK